MPSTYFGLKPATEVRECACAREVEFVAVVGKLPVTSSFGAMFESCAKSEPTPVDTGR